MTGMDLFDLKAVISLDSEKFEKGIEGVKNGLATAAKVGAAAVGAAATAVAAITSKSVAAYGEYEQLVGGVQKLYGNMGLSLEEYAKQQGQSIDEAKAKWAELDEAQTLVQKNAEQAYRTAGMSMNEYMDTATGFSAALINSLGGDTLKAAEQTDVAMRAISDNFNTFGGDINNVRNAYMGFAKQNYTMLDNLKLGYGGTKTEMERLIEDANEYAKSIGLASNLSIESFSDVVSAIDLIQQKQQIAGTTAREASTTIQGSLGMLKSAWENLLTGMADSEANLDQLMDNVVDSIVGTTDEAGNHINGFLDNVMPVVETSITSVGNLIEKVAPIIGQKLPAIIGDLIPKFLNAGAELIGALVRGFADNALNISWGLGDIVEQLLQSLADATSNLGDGSILGIIENLISGIVENYDIIGLGYQIITNLINGITQGIPQLMDDITYWFDIIAYELTEPANTKGFIEAGIKFISSLIQGFISQIPSLTSTLSSVLLNIVETIGQSGPELIEAVVGIVESIADTLPNFIDVFIRGVMSIIDGIVAAFPAIVTSISDAIPRIIQSVVNTLTSAIPQLVSGVITLINSLVAAIPQIIKPIISALPGMIQSIVKSLISLLPVILDGVVQLVLGIVQALPEIVTMITDMLPEIITMIINTLIELLPVLIDGTVMLINGLVDALPQIIEALVNSMGDIIQAIVDALMVSLPLLIDGAIQLVAALVVHIPEIIAGLISAIPSIIGMIISGFGALGGRLLEIFTNAFTTIGSSITQWWTQKKQDIATGFDAFINDAKQWFEKLPYNLGVALGNMIVKFGEFATNAGKWVTTEIPKIIDNIVKFFKELPEKVWEWLVGVVEKVGEWGSSMIETITTEVPKIIDNIVKFFEELPGKALQWGKDMISNFIAGIGAMAEDAWNAVSDFAKGIADRLGFSEPKLGPLSNFHTYAPDMMELFAKGIAENTHLVTDEIEKSFDFSDAITAPNSEFEQSYRNDTSNALLQVVTLLQEILDRGMEISLEGDAREIFNVVEKQNRERTKATGYNPLAMAGG